MEEVNELDNLTLSTSVYPINKQFLYFLFITMQFDIFYHNVHISTEDKISADQKINVIPSENTCKIVCQLMRVMDLPSGHMLIYGNLT